MNYVVQGSCADGLKYALVALAAQLPPEARIVGTVHDEILVECPREGVPAVLVMVRDAMLGACRQPFDDLPVAVEAKACETWGDK